jgi:hypothetical protein
MVVVLFVRVALARAPNERRRRRRRRRRRLLRVVFSG